MRLVGHLRLCASALLRCSLCVFLACARFSVAVFSCTLDSSLLGSRSRKKTFTHFHFNAWKRCRQKKDAQGNNYIGILDRLLKSPRYRKSQEEHGWDEAKCADMDKLAQEDHTYKLTRSEYLRYSSNWCLQLDESGSNAPMATRPDYRAAVALKDHLYRNSEDYQEPIPPQGQDRVRENNKFSETYCQGARVDKKTLWKFWTLSSSSSSWWQSDQWDWEEY